MSQDFAVSEVVNRHNLTAAGVANFLTVVDDFILAGGLEHERGGEIFVDGLRDALNAIKDLPQSAQDLFSEGLAAETVRVANAVIELVDAVVESGRQASGKALVRAIALIGLCVVERDAAAGIVEAQDALLAFRDIIDNG